MRKVIIILCVFLLTGCYDYQEINDLDIVSSILVDYVDNEYVVNLEILDTKENATNGSYFIEEKGKTIEEALSNMYLRSKKSPYYSHMYALIASNRVVDNGLEKIYDYFSRDIDIQKDFLFFISEDLNQFLEYKTEQGESIGLNSYDMAKKTKEKNGYYRTSNFREIVYNYLRNLSYFIGSISIIDEQIQLQDSYVFINNTNALKIDPKGVLVANMFNQDNKSFTYDVDNSYEIYEYKLDKKVSKDKIILELNGQIKLLNMENSKSFTKDDIESLEKKINDSLKKLLEDTIKFSIAQDKDFLNLNYDIYLYYPNESDNDSWKNIEYEVKSSLKVTEKGMLLDSLGGNKDER